MWFRLPCGPPACEWAGRRTARYRGNQGTAEATPNSLLCRFHRGLTVIRSQQDKVVVSRLVGIVDGDAARRAALLAEFGPSAVTIVDETTSSCLAPAFMEREAMRASETLGRPLDLVSSCSRSWLRYGSGGRQVLTQDQSFLCHISSRS